MSATGYDTSRLYFWIRHYKKRIRRWFAEEDRGVRTYVDLLGAFDVRISDGMRDFFYSALYSLVTHGVITEHRTEWSGQDLMHSRFSMGPLQRLAAIEVDEEA